MICEPNSCTGRALAEVAIAGSRRLPKGHAVRLLLDFLLHLPEGDRINLRRGIGGSGEFEHDVLRLCDILQIPVRFWTPEPTKEQPGRMATWVRDLDMAQACEVLLAFVTPDDLADASGTLNLIEQAWRSEVATYAYLVDEMGWPHLYGSSDPGEAWTGRVPA
jgi:hypothetical protein